MNKHHKTVLIPALCIAAFFTMSACADSKTADTQQKNTADKSDTQQGIDIAAYEKKLADNRENYKLSCEQYSTDTDTIIQSNITKEQISPKTSSFRGFLYIPINLSDTTKTHEISTVTNK